MGEERPKGTGVNGPSEGPDDVLGRRAQRSADAHLGDHHGGKDGPQSVQGNGQKLGEREGQYGCNGNTQTVAQRSSVSAELSAHQRQDSRLLHACGSLCRTRSSRLIYLYLIIGPPTKAREPGSAYGSFGRHS